MLHKQAPETPLAIEENYTERLRDTLKQGELDAILIALPFREPGLSVRALYEEPFVALLPCAHPWREREALKLRDLAKEPLLLLGPGHCFREQILQLCPACHRVEEAAGRHGVVNSSLETLRHMVGSGMGITVLPCTAAGADKYAQRLVVVKRFVPPVRRRRVAMAWRSSYPRREAIAVVEEALRACRLRGVEFLSQDDSN